MKNKTRVRFAPSPTGFLHVGGLRTALYNYLFAKQNDGDIVLRIEDTDQKRFVEGAVEGLLRAFSDCGLEWNEGPMIESSVINHELSTIDSKNYPGITEVGDSGPYIQSERLEIYQKYAKQLVVEGKAYYCFCEPERLEKMRADQTAAKRAPMYDRYCLASLKEEEINEQLKKNCPATIRLKVPKNETIEFEDIIRGKMKIDTDTVDDQVLLKSDGFPTYHLANVVDDHLMAITHVIRGEEWLPSTSKHILLYCAFNWDLPQFAHLPLLLNPDRSKLSKRKGDVSVESYLSKGYLPEALVNFVSLLGWNPGKGNTQEVFSIVELIEKFKLENVHKGGAVFDLRKLDWINGEYIKKMSLEKLFSAAKEHYLKNELVRIAPESFRTDEYLMRVLTVERERLVKLSDVANDNPFFFSAIKYELTLLNWKTMTKEDLKISLELAKKVLSEVPDEKWTREYLESVLLAAAGEKRGELLWPLRVSLTGAQKSPSPFEVAWALGKEKSLFRLNEAISMA